MERWCERPVGYDRLIGEHASAATHGTLPSTAPVCQLFSALDETPVEATGREKKCGASTIQPRLHCSACSCQASCMPEAARTDRGGTRARPHAPLLTIGAVATGRLPLCRELLFLRFTHPFCTHPRLFRRRLYRGKASCREKRTRSGSSVSHLVPRAGEEKTLPGLAAHPERPL
jgi:hypothetical protein